MFIRAAALAAVCLLLYVWVLPAVLGSGGTGRFPSYVDGLDREIENAIRHEESGRPWESYDERQARWIRERATFSAIDEADHHPRGYKEVEWHDGVRRNVSLDRLWRAMRHITLDPVCVCAAHLLVPLNVVRLPDEGRTVVFDPLIITAAGKPMERCFRDPLFGYDHDGGHQGAAEPEAEAAAPGHCEAFPEQLFVEYHTGFGGGARGTSRRTWFNDNASVMCIVHCSSIATRSVVYNGEGGLLAGYATKLYAQRRNRGGGGGPK
jgi:hypothetical protein